MYRSTYPEDEISTIKNTYKLKKGSIKNPSLAAELYGYSIVLTSSINDYT